LRFTNLNAASANDISPNGRVLTVDNNGHVVLTNDMGGGGSGTVTDCGATIPATDVNHITKWSNLTGANREICRTGIFENGSLDVGIGNPTSLSAKLNIEKTSTASVTGVSIVTSSPFTNFGCNSTQTTGNNVVSYYSDINNVTSGAQNRSIFASLVATTGSTNAILDATLVNPTGTTPQTTINYGFRGIIGNGSSVQSNFNYGNFIQSYSSRYNYGFWADVITSPSGNDVMNCAAHFDAGNSNSYAVDDAVAVDAYAHGATNNNIGVLAQANSSATTNYALFGKIIQPNTGNTNYAVYGECTSWCTGSTTLGSCSSAAGYFAGAVFTTNDYWKSSDAMLKTNVTNIPNANALLLQLQPKSYLYDTAQFSQMNLPSGTHYGLMAQDVEQVFPQFVKNLTQPEVKDSLGNITHAAVNFKAITYDNFVPLLIKGFQDQKQQLDSLKNRLDSLAAVVSNCCNMPLRASTTENKNILTVELENTQAIVLNQNEPNPFAENTTITWNIPSTESKELNAMLLFYDNTGSVLKTVKINQPGSGSLLVYGSKLSSGIYTYSLVVDTKTVETKRMMKVK
jgi:hypothetical protein